MRTILSAILLATVIIVSYSFGTYTAWNEAAGVIYILQQRDLERDRVQDQCRRGQWL